MGQIRILLGPSQFFEDAAQTDYLVHVAGFDQRWFSGTQRGKPTEDMWIAAQLIQTMNLVMIGAEIIQEVLYGGVIATKGIRTQRSSERVHGSQKDVLQGMPKWTAVFHG